MDVYLDALEKEMQLYKTTSLKTIYFGGGTPSLLSVDQLKRLTEMVKHTFELKDLQEWTIETNPDDVNGEKVDALLELGVNRFSLGIQTFDRTRLLELGRNHTREQAQKAYALYREKESKNVSVDFMFAFPRQTLEELKEDLEQIANLQSQHISLYCLNVEPNSKFYTKMIDQPGDEDQILFYTQITSFLQSHGWEQYEVSNFAKPGFQSVHNRNYWEGGNYIGLGVGGHSFVDGCRFFNVDRLTDYIERATKNKSCRASEEYLSNQDCLTENVLFRLRMNEGVVLRKLENQFQTRLTEEQVSRLQQFCDQGLLIQQGDCIKASDRGRLLLDEIAPYFL